MNTAFAALHKFWYVLFLSLFISKYFLIFLVISYFTCEKLCVGLCEGYKYVEFSQRKYVYMCCEIQSILLDLQNLVTLAHW